MSERPKPNLFRYFSLFSGIGGFELGIQRASAQIQMSQKGQTKIRNTGEVDYETTCNLRYNRPASPICTGFSEIDKYASQIYKTHFPNHKEYGDVTAINWSDTEDFDFLVGGFPCQAFSIAGKRKGFADTRGTLFFEIARCLAEKHPRFLLLENVKGLLSHDKGQTFGTILSTLDELRYDLQWQVLNSKNFGVPQNRERVFIVGHLRGGSRPEVFPIRESSQGLFNYLGGIISAREKWLDDGKTNGRNFSQGQRVYGIDGVSQTLAGNAGGQGGKTGLYQITGTLDANYYKGANRPSNKSNRPKVFDCGGIRRLTPTECERLQGFPDGWTEGISDTQRYKCLGNAVTVNIIEAIVTRLLEETKQ